VPHERSGIGIRTRVTRSLSFSMASKSAATEAALAQWQSQVEAMKKAIAQLKLPSRRLGLEDLDYDDIDDDDDDDDVYAHGSPKGGQDVWDFVSDSELAALGLDSGDLTDATDISTPAAAYGPEWFAIRCSEAAARSGLPSGTLQDQIMDALKSSRPEDELQSQLTDLVGFDDLDFVIELLAHRKDVVRPVAAAPENSQPTGHKLLTKAQREEALRQKDFRHKTAALASASAKEPQYPHVYRAYSPGNTLSSSGKRYALPVGSTRHEFEKYEEYAIPAGKAGVLGPGQKLINISDLDGLCRRTFKGYKALNRMQSLVFPVAYKTSENMLICAPTGAVCRSEFHQDRALLTRRTGQNGRRRVDCSAHRRAIHLTQPGRESRGHRLRRRCR